VEIGGKTNIHACLTSTILLDHRSVDSKDQRLASVPLPTSSFHCGNSMTVLNIMLVGTLQSSLIVDLLQDES
jgi:hypothetical protein